LPLHVNTVPLANIPRKWLRVCAALALLER
jgi:hypothetical protein